MRCFVTGAAGFIGSHLCEALLAAGHTVVGIDDLSTGRRENLPLQGKQFRFIHRNVKHYIPIGRRGEIDWVFHLAAQAAIVPSVTRPHFYHTCNVNGTVNVLEAARKSGVRKFIYAASSSCYGIPDKFPTDEAAPIRPQYPYALTKFLGECYVEHWARVYRMPAVSLRLFNVYGPRARTNGTYGAVMGVFLAQLANGKPLTVVGDGTQSRDFTYVTDVVAAFMRAAEADTGDYFCANVGSDAPQTINRLIELIAPEAERIALPWRPGEPLQTFADCARIHAALGWYPKVSFEDGVAAMLADLPEFKAAPVWTAETAKAATADWHKYLGVHQ